MAPKSLLRYIYRHHAPPQKNPTTNTTAAAPQTPHLSKPNTPAPIPESFTPTPSKTIEPTILEDIAEEDQTPTCTPSPTPPPPTFLSETLTALNIPPTTSLTTRDLLHTTLHEAKAAIATHLETLDDALVLLSALRASGSVIGMWEGEMRERRRVCVERRGVLEEVERVFGGGGVGG
ncbi:hypothetical protein P153DRAFT_381732 [Dothidotthia symphoricarpi CBS 119687]|uniref:Uncharacterized protein n=1 Tax=Dothidotthia symphoricarpi CBS 119687 TaxID=1392245 RepID=A0A6A6AQQ9_9PLEO|nr:uncharacterized protein P153DRAFT_381732 [Dothidotthia symphoricarpi CBS 119687]KAF2133294.1 hypothetical protein P153DRAFT_381732 [Dothidotthia symphoricarpi CBS 119687]